MEDNGDQDGQDRCSESEKCDKCSSEGCGKCLLCGVELCAKPKVTVYDGLQKLFECSFSKRDRLHDNFKEEIKKFGCLTLHVDCRRRYTRHLGPFSTDQPQTETETERLLRSAEKGFDSKVCCIFCGEKAVFDKKHPERNGVSLASTLGMKQTILERARKRQDEMARRVLTRVSAVSDLVAADVRYHNDCLPRFLSVGESNGESKGDPTNPSGTYAHNRGSNAFNTSKAHAFSKLCEFLEESGSQQHTLDSLMQRMRSFSTSGEIYSGKHLKNLLQQRYGEAIVISSHRGKEGYFLVTFMGAARQILTGSWHNERSSNLQDEKRRIIEMAAELIRDACLTCSFDTSHYPSIEEIESGGKELVPDLLQLFLEKTMRPKKSKTPAPVRKRLAVGNAIVSSICPKSFLSPLQIGLGVYLQRKLGSRLVIDVLSNLGMVASYHEVMKYVDCSVLHAAAVIREGAFLQFVFDNFDHNVRTLTGHGTVHVLGGLMAVTPGQLVESKPPLPRPSESPSSTEIGRKGVLAVKPFIGQRNRGLSRYVMKDVMVESLQPENLEQCRSMDALWMSGHSLEVEKCPGWFGFMESMLSNCGGKHPKTTLVPLPIVNLAATDPSSIHTALLFAQKKCTEQDQKTCVVTFDQPLFLKAMDTAAAAGLSSVVVRLGGFHLLMSFMGAVGQLMGGSGLADMWEKVYAKNTIPAMMAGHAYARALRAHFLSQLAIVNFLIKRGCESGDINPETVRNILRRHEEAKEKRVPLNCILMSECIAVLRKFLTTATETGKEGRSGRLWMQYLEQVDFIRLFVRAERSGDWKLHLYCVQRMLPFFCAAGHFNYAKTAHLYLQEMISLETKMTPDEYEKFVGQGWFTIFRFEDECFSGTWSDMIIEQVLMRALKVMGGLTHGRGTTESSISRFVNSAPHVTNVLDSIEEFSGVKSSHSNQHAELGASRQRRDAAHAAEFAKYFIDHNPFSQPADSLVCISTGLIADSTVNCDRAEEIGRAMLDSVVGKSFTDIHYKRKERAINIAATNNTIKLADEKIQVNPSTLYHRIVCVVQSEEELEDCMSYELAPRPVSLFGEIGMRGGAKSKLIKVLEQECLPSCDKIPGATYVIDGGFLLHRPEWPRPATYATICDVYVTYVTQIYGVGSTVVFDGYSDGPSTKDEQHLRRASIAAKVSVSPESFAVLTKKEFLGNSHNKAQLIPLLATKLREAGMVVRETTGDADLTIVQTALEISRSQRNIVMVGEDTDLLVLLVALAEETEVKMLMPGRQEVKPRIFSSSGLQTALGARREFLMVFHALTGCDTTSAPYCKAKKTAFDVLKRIVKQKLPILEQLRMFYNPAASHEEIAAAGEAFLVALYNGRHGETLNRTRFLAYKKQTARQKVSSKFELARLPPTSDAARYHSYRAYHTVQAWLGNDLRATSWGWKEEKGYYRPVTMSRSAAPDCLLKLVFCNCKTVCGTNCTCKRAGLLCTTTCGFCSGDACSNCPGPIHEEEEDDIEAEDDEQEEGDNTDILDSAKGIFLTPAAEDVEEVSPECVSSRSKNSTIRTLRQRRR